MANAKKDNNQIPVMLGTANTDGSTLVMVKADPATHSIDSNDAETGTDLSGDNATRDENSIPVLLAVSSDDGETPVAVYADPSNGQILIKST